MVRVVFESLLRLRHMEFNETLFALFSEFRQTCNHNVIGFSFRSQVYQMYRQQKDARVSHTHRAPFLCSHTDGFAHAVYAC